MHALRSREPPAPPPAAQPAAPDSADAGDGSGGVGEEEGEGEGEGRAVQRSRGGLAQGGCKATQRFWSVVQSPLVQAIEKWADAKKRRPAAYGGGDRQQSKSVIVQMDEDSGGAPQFGLRVCLGNKTQKGHGLGNTSFIFDYYCCCDYCLKVNIPCTLDTLH
eukprot:1160274-Pelagomonas_calceolata.AAC.2